MEIAPLRELGRSVADQEDRALARAEPDEALRCVLAQRAADRPLRAKKRARARMAIAAAAILSSVLAVLVAVSTSSRALTFTVGEPARAGIVSEWVSARSEAQMPVHFSDGTRIVLAPRAQGRVVRLTARGAEFVIESGRAEIAVVPNEKGDFRIRTGPFVVFVHGTRFSVDWDPIRDAFVLSLREGHVTVSGCAFGAGRAVSPGETIRASCGDAKPSTPPVEPTEPVKPSAAGPLASMEPAPAARAPKASVPKSPESWIDLAHDGLYAEAYRTATAKGLTTELRTRNAAEVLLLGDVCRHVGHSAEARTAYETVRQRFPGSEPAANAAFALGRLSFDGSHDLAAAAASFETYLGERPGGPLSAAALGRLLEARLGLRQREAAVAVARRYLALYPNGPLANEAQKVAGSNE